MIVTGHEAFLLTLLFVVTGYITHSVAARFTFRKNERPELLLLRFLAYGTLNALVLLPFIATHTKVLPRETWAGILVHNLAAYYELAIWTLFLMPVLLGVVIGIFHTLYGLKDWFNAPVASWDERIARSRGRWVLVSLENGNRVAGFLGREAAVVSDTGERDLYLQTLCFAEVSGVWQKVPRSQGMLISGKGIQSIEFWEDEGVKPANLKERLKAWLFPENGRVPPIFQSSMIAGSAKLEEAATVEPVEAKDEVPLLVEVPLANAATATTITASRVGADADLTTHYNGNGSGAASA